MAAMRASALAALAAFAVVCAACGGGTADTSSDDGAAVGSATTTAPEPETEKSASTEESSTTTATPSPEPTATAIPEPARPTAVTVSSATVELTALGATEQLSAEVRDQDSTVMIGVTVAWTTSSNSVATVDVVGVLPAMTEAGVVTAAGNGTATITASAGSASGSAVVTVTQAVALVGVLPAMTELTAWGETVQLTAEAFDANGHGVAGAVFAWESADALVAEVDALGLVSGIGEGVATITASAGSASGSAVVTVTQAVALVGVLPAMTELTAWGETVQLTAEAFDANGHGVAGAVFAWESADALVAEVDALGLVSGIGEGVATITASAGSASGSAIVTVPPTFTLSGTVRDSRRNGPMLAGAVVRLENGNRESMVIGPDGRYRFPSVWGTVTVRVIARPTHVTETVEIAMDEDRTLDFDLEHTGVPPSPGTVYISTRVIEPSDPTTLGNITHAGRGERLVYDRRPGMRITINAYLFDVRYAGQVVEFRVNPEFGSIEAAQAEVETYAPALGQMPAVLMAAITHVVIHAGDEPWGGGILIHTDRGEDYIRDGFMEEIMVHEATHTALDPAHTDSPGWRAAQAADGVFISGYARDHPDREDVAESFLAWFALRYQSEQVNVADRAVIRRTIPNRLAYFDEQGFDMSPYTPSEVQYPSNEIVTIQGKVIGPNNQPLEGIFLWAWAGSVDNSGNARTGEDGSFAIVVPDGSFTLNLYAAGEGCTFIGWYGPGGFTTVGEDATRIEVDGESVLDIVVRLPDHPDALPRIEWCA